MGKFSLSCVTVSVVAAVIFFIPFFHPKCNRWVSRSNLSLKWIESPGEQQRTSGNFIRQCMSMVTGVDRTEDICSCSIEFQQRWAWEVLG